MTRAAKRFGLSATQHRVLRIMGGYVDPGIMSDRITVSTLRALHRRSLIESKDAPIAYPSGELPGIEPGAQWYAFQLTRDGSYIAAALGKWRQHDRSQGRTASDDSD